MQRPNSSGGDSFRLRMTVEAGEDIQVIKPMKGSLASKIYLINAKINLFVDAIACFVQLLSVTWHLHCTAKQKNQEKKKAFNVSSLCCGKQ